METWIFGYYLQTKDLSEIQVFLIQSMHPAGKYKPDLTNHLSDRPSLVFYHTREQHDVSSRKVQPMLPSCHYLF